MSADQPETKADEIRVTVTFPIAQTGPFHEDVVPTTTIGSVRSSAMAKFGIAEDGQHRYYLTHHGTMVADDATVSSVASDAHAVAFTLVKELVQG